MTNEIKAKDFEPAKFELETNGTTYVLELSVEAIKKADEMNFIGKAPNMGIQELLQNLIFVFLLKSRGSALTPNLSKKIADSIIEEKEYEIGDLCADLLEELAVRYNQVFTSKGKKKALKKI